MPSKDDIDPQEQEAKPFLAHLEDLRSTIVLCAVVLAVGIGVSIPLAPYVVDLLQNPLREVDIDPDTFLKIFQMTGGVSIAMKVAFWNGIMISLPFIIFFVAKFVFPGLTKRETKCVMYSAGFSSVLFVVGVCMGYFMTLPVAIRMMLRINSWLGVETEWVEFSDYIGFVLKLLVAFGCAFQLPVIVLALGSFGILNSTQLRTHRNYVIVGLLVLAMFLTPADPYTMVLMGVPLILLYEACIWIIWLKEKRKG